MSTRRDPLLENLLTKLERASDQAIAFGRAVIAIDDKLKRDLVEAFGGDARALSVGTYSAPSISEADLRLPLEPLDLSKLQRDLEAAFGERLLKTPSHFPPPAFPEPPAFEWRMPLPSFPPMTPAHAIVISHRSNAEEAATRKRDRKRAARLARKAGAT